MCQGGRSRQGGAKRWKRSKLGGRKGERGERAWSDGRAEGFVLGQGKENRRLEEMCLWDGECERAGNRDGRRGLKTESRRERRGTARAAVPSLFLVTEP
ncbi:hypothetical protein FKM82_024707 [Ascaphus truei]